MVILSALLVGWTSETRAENRRKIVMFLDGTPLSLQQLIVTLTGSQVIHVLSLINALAIELPLVGEVLGIVDTLLKKPEVIGVFDDIVGFADDFTDGSTTFSWENFSSKEVYDWGQDRIGVPDVHQRMPELRGTGVKIAILDSGVDDYHPDLWQNIAGGFNAMRGGKWKSYRDGYGHGTHMAGIIAAPMNDQGIVGVAPQARILAVKVLDDNGFGYLSDVINGLQWAYKNQVRLVNMSLGFFEDSEPLKQATWRLYTSGMIIVASAGNKGCPPGQDEGAGSEEEDAVPVCDSSQLGVKYPARYWWVMAVTATDFYDHVPDYCQSGPEVHIAAPGGAQANERILSTKPGGGYVEKSGTSQATAHVTGVVALTLQRKPDLSFGRMLDLLRRTARDLGYSDARQGAGLIDVQSLMKALE
jgi:subtilisin family serine protease